MSRDPYGYYSLIGVPPTATESEIKTAYRRLAKLYHPDAGKSADQGERFKTITEAYTILSDPDARAKYDGISAAATATRPSAKEATTKPEPIKCSHCNRVTAQPRFVVLWQVVSFVVGTVRTPVQGIFCAQCARKKALKATLITATAGWWGVPWGPIWTIVEGLKNAFGGTTIQAANERLLWHNAVAFGLSGDVKLSIALAEKLIDSDDKEIAERAENIVKHFQSHGIHTGSGALKDPWVQPTEQIILHLILIAALPLALYGLVLANNERHSIYSTSRTTAVDQSLLVPPPTYEAIPKSKFDPDQPWEFASPSSSDAAPEATEASEAGAPAPNVAQKICELPPSNGKILVGNELLKPKGHVLEIKNGSAGDAIIKLRDAVTMETIASFFVESSQSAALSGVPDGTYVIQYAFGTSLSESCEKFNRIEVAGQFPETETLKTVETEDETGTSVERMHLSYTLYSVPSGNVRPETIDASTFESDSR